MTEQLTTWFASLFSDSVSHEIIIFLTSLLPVLECRGGMILAKLFEINFFKAFLICYVGNMIPMPFIILFIKEIFKFMKKHKLIWMLLESTAMKKLLITGKKLLIKLKQKWKALKMLSLLP